MPAKRDPCPVPGCRNRRRAGSLFCWWHWTHLAPPYRQMLLRASRDEGPTSAAFRAAYREALAFWESEAAAAFNGGRG